MEIEGIAPCVLNMFALDGVSDQTRAPAALFRV